MDMITTANGAPRGTLNKLAVGARGEAANPGNPGEFRDSAVDGSSGEIDK
jgi:hypothetical protein